MLRLGEAVALLEVELAVFDWAAADRALLALDVAALAVGLALGRAEAADAVELGLALVEPLAALPDSDWAAAVAAPLVVPDVEPVGVGVTDTQLAVPDGLALPEVDELPDGLALPEADVTGAELDGAELEVAELAGTELDGTALGSLLGLVVGFGGRLDFGGRTLVTSLMTGNGLSGSAAEPSR